MQTQILFARLYPLVCISNMQFFVSKITLANAFSKYTILLVLVNRNCLVILMLYIYIK